MASIDYSSREINSRIVYFGPGLSGKTENLKVIQNKTVPPGASAITIARDAERTLFFDFLPLELGEINGFRARFQLYTLPGRLFYEASRGMILRDADGFVFVADSRFDRVGDNIECIEGVRADLRGHQKNLSEIPYVVQYNKRDLPNVIPVADLKGVLNPEGVEDFEAVASAGAGVLPTFKAIVRRVLMGLKGGAKSS